MIRLVQKFRNVNVNTQGAIALVCLGLYFLSSHFLEKSYALSKFPVSYFEQQTSFNAIKLKAWYAHMIAEDTFDIYVTTQFIDFAFIAAVMLAGFTLFTFVSNLHPKFQFFNKWGYIFAFALPVAGTFDIFENLVSFLMIANPENFNDVLALFYSSFAVLKFFFWTIGLIWLMLSIVSIPFTRIQPNFFANLVRNNR